MGPLVGHPSRNIALFLKLKLVQLNYDPNTKKIKQKCERKKYKI